MQKHGKQETEASAPQKTVRVTDEAGHAYEATYMKRAKGLVKHGRARFTDESQTAIILACPPNQSMILEDNTMNEQIKNTENTEAETAAVETAAAETVSSPTDATLTVKEVFDQIVALQNLMSGEHTNPLHSLSSTVGSICSDTTWESDELRCGAVNAASTPYRIREETYQQMLALYQQIYSNLQLQIRGADRRAERAEFMNWVRDCIDATQCGQDLPDFERLWKLVN